MREWNIALPYAKGCYEILDVLDEVERSRCFSYVGLRKKLVPRKRKEKIRIERKITGTNKTRFKWQGKTKRERKHAKYKIPK